MTHIIRASEAHDFLALVPALTGYRPNDSFVCIPFHGNRTIGVLRFDLPYPADIATSENFAAAVVGTVCRLDAADSMVVVVYTDSRFADARAMPDRAVLETCVASAEHAGYLVRDALCVAADGWGSCFDTELPELGHPLALIESSEITRHPAVRAEADAPNTAARQPAAFAALPTPEPCTAASIAHILEMLSASDEPLDEHASWMRDLGEHVDPVAFVEHLVDIAGRDERPSAAEAAWFAHLSTIPPYRDAMLLQFAFGAVIGEAALDDSAMYNAAAAREGICLDELIASERMPMHADHLARLLLGETTVRPDADRTNASFDLVRWMSAHAPAGQRSGALCIAGWLAWALGRGTAAGLLLERAVEEEPGHGMSTLLLTYLSRGVLPEWAFSVPDDHPAFASTATNEQTLR